MTETRKPLTLPWEEFKSKAPACAQYARLQYQSKLLENKVNTNFEAAWAELSKVLSLTSTLFVKHPDGKQTYVFKIGASITEKANAEFQNQISAAYKAKDKVLEDAAAANDAFVTYISNFTVSFPGLSVTKLPTQERSEELVKSTTQTVAKLKLSWEEFTAQFPQAAPVLLAKDEFRRNEKELKTLWTLASAELAQINPEQNQTFQVVDTETEATYTIAHFKNRHVALKDIPNNNKFRIELAQAYAQITKTNDFLKIKGYTTTKTTPFFSAYTQ